MLLLPLYSPRSPPPALRRRGEMEENEKPSSTSESPPAKKAKKVPTPAKAAAATRGGTVMGLAPGSRPRTSGVQLPGTAPAPALPPLAR